MTECNFTRTAFHTDSFTVMCYKPKYGLHFEICVDHFHNTMDNFEIFSEYLQNGRIVLTRLNCYKFLPHIELRCC